jgi:DNA-binding MarR family transcriptional regulator
MECKFERVTMTNADVFERLVRVQILLWNAVDSRLREAHELPLTWFEPMRVVAELGQARVRDIAETLVITEGGASKLVDRIQAAGYLDRQPHPDDGRSSQLVLTAKGNELLEAARRTRDAELEHRMGTVDLAGFAAALDLLEAANTRQGA